MALVFRGLEIPTVVGRRAERIGFWELGHLTHQLAVASCCLLAALLIGQLPLVLAFLRILNRWQSFRRDDAPCPKVAVILCLRGPDPFLADCIRAILNQDYPTYELRVVVDSMDDPAWEVVARAVAGSGVQNVRVAQLTKRRETCSLKCSNLVQAVSDLDESFEVVALVDADTVPHTTWLRDLVAPFADPAVGATTGGRWYMPSEVSWGSLVRYWWNVAAVVQMYCYGIAWGGALAVKTEVFRQSDLLDRWSNALCEDTMLKTCLAELGLKVQFVPSLMMVNREGCDIAGYFGWVRRQLLTARLYHPLWPAVLGHGVLTFLGPLFALTVAVYAALAESEWDTAVWALGGLVGYEVGLISTAFMLEASVRRIVRARGEPLPLPSTVAALKTVVALPFTQLIYALALAAAQCLSSVGWRGVLYRIDARRRIRLIEYRPFADADKPPESNTSL